MAPRRSHTVTAHGDSWPDPWFWLREQDDPATLEYLKAENAYTDAFLEPLKSLQDTLYDEIRGRIKEDDNTVPEKEGDYYYYVRYEEGGQYPIYCRKHGSEDGDEEILLDVNALAEGHEYTRVGTFENSPDHQLIAYGVDHDGSEQYTIHVVDLGTGQELPDIIPNTYYSLEWSNDNRNLYYSVLDEHHRPVSIYRHTLGDEPNDDQLVYQEEDPRFFVGCGKSNTGRFIYVVAGGNNMSEWRFLDANDPESVLALIEPRYTDFEYDVVDHSDQFFVRHNGGGAKDFKVSTTPVSAPGWENWSEFIDHEPGRPIRGIDAYREHLVVACRNDGLPQVMVHRLTDGDVHYVAGVDEDDFAMSPRSGREFDTVALRFGYTSLKTPAAVYDYDMETRDRVLRKQQEVPSGYDPAQYETRRIWARARDGTQVPISLLMRNGTAADGSAPLYLYGYGSYGLTMEASFSISALSSGGSGVHIRHRSHSRRDGDGMGLVRERQTLEQTEYVQ